MSVSKVLLGLFVVALSALPLMPVSAFWISQANYIGLYALVTLSLVLLTGVVGLTSFGQAAFVGIGAYVTAYFTLAHGLSPWLTLPLGLVVTAAAAYALGAVTLRMSGHYLPLATIAWGLALYHLFGSIEALGKYDGLSGLAVIELFGWRLETGREMYWLIWLAVLLSIWALHNLLDSRPGRAIRALKGGVTMAEAMGADTRRYKTQVFIIAALLASLSGWLFAHLQRSINPTPFGLHQSLEFVVMAVIGGIGNLWGAVLGAGAVKLLQDQLQVWLPHLFGRPGNFEIIVFGLILVLLLRFAPQGAWPFLARLVPRPDRGPTPPAQTLPRRAQPASGELVLDVEDVSKRFGGLLAVDQVSFQVKAGEIVGLIGPNGAGKSTTFNLVTGLLRPDGGEVRFLGSSLQGLPSREIARLGIGRSFQHVKLLPTMSVLENVALGAHQRSGVGLTRAMLRLDRDEEARLLYEAERNLERVGLAECRHLEAGSLALGQQRIVEIARALCADPVLLLLDEPAAGLRHLEKQALADLLRQLSGEGISILLVEHDMDFVMRLTDHIVVMDFGRKIAEGAPHAVQSDPAVVEAYLGSAA